MYKVGALGKCPVGGWLGFLEDCLLNHDLDLSNSKFFLRNLLPFLDIEPYGTTFSLELKLYLEHGMFEIFALMSGFSPRTLLHSRNCSFMETGIWHSTLKYLEGSIFIKMRQFPQMARGEIFLYTMLVACSKFQQPLSILRQAWLHTPNPHDLLVPDL